MKNKIKKWVQNKVQDILYIVRSYCAVIMYNIGKKPACSTFIDEVTITAGYGKLSNIGDFQYNLPRPYIKKLFKGCNK